MQASQAPADVPPTAFDPPAALLVPLASPGFQPFVDSKDWERDIVGVARCFPRSSLSLLCPSTFKTFGLNCGCHMQVPAHVPGTVAPDHRRPAGRKQRALPACAGVLHRLFRLHRWRAGNPDSAHGDSGSFTSGITEQGCCYNAGLSFEAALREYLESFRLPGEAQKIYRILDAWSRQFFKQCPGFFKSADAVHVLAFSLVLLNTDHHKSVVRRPTCCMQV